MKITKINPIGYCYGVKKALKQVISINKITNKNIKLLGNLVHNEYTIKNILPNNIKCLNVEPNQYFNNLKNSNKNDLIIFSAHGHNLELNAFLDEKKTEYIDTTCPIVIKNYNDVLNTLKNDEIVFYIGKKNHPEISMFNNLENFYFIDIKDPVIPQIKSNTIINIFGQTTISLDSFNNITSKIKKLYTKIKINNSLCPMVYEREKKLIDVLNNNYTKILIIGSKTSSNTNTLYNIAIKNNLNKKKIYLITSKNDIKKEFFNNNDNIAILSGTSTSEEEINIIINKLNSLF